MADTSDLKSDALNEHEGSSPSSGISEVLKKYKALIKDPNHPYLKYLEELVKKYEST